MQKSSLSAKRNEAFIFAMVLPMKKAFSLRFRSILCSEINDFSLFVRTFVQHLPYSVLRTTSVLVISNTTDILRYPNRMFESRSYVVADLGFILFNCFAIFRFRY